LILQTVFFYILLATLIGFLWKKNRIKPFFAPNHSKLRPRDILLATCGYIFLTCLFFSPLLGSFNETLIGPLEDNQIFYWNFWWAEKALLNPQIPFFYSQDIYYPEGDSLIFQSFTFYNLGLGLLMSPFWSRITFYNFLILHSFVLAGLGTYCLIHYLIGNRSLAFLGGIIFAFNPSHYAHALHHLNIASIQFFPFFLLFYIRALQHKKKMDFVFCGLFFFLNTLCSWYYLIFMIYFMLFAYLYLAIQRKSIFLKDALLLNFICAFSTFILLNPLLLRMMEMGFKGKVIGEGGHNFFVTDLFGFLIPHAYHPLGNVPIFRTLQSRFTGNDWESAAYLGWVNLAVVILTLRKHISSSAPYLLGCLVFGTLALGSYLHIGGYITSVLLPSAINEHMPFFSLVRSPSRHMVWVYLFWSITVVLALQSLLASQKSKVLKKTVVSILAFFIILDFSFLSRSASELNVPEIYQPIMEENSKNSFGILNFPGTTEDNRKYMMHQAHHEIPMCNGKISRRTRGSAIDRLPRNPTKLKKFLKRQRVKYILFHSPDELTSLPKAEKTIDSLEPFSLEYLIQNFPIKHKRKKEIAFEVY